MNTINTKDDIFCIKLRDMSPEASNLDCTDLIIKFKDKSTCRQWRTALKKAILTRVPEYGLITKVCTTLVSPELLKGFAHGIAQVAFCSQ